MRGPRCCAMAFCFWANIRAFLVFRILWTTFGPKYFKKTEIYVYASILRQDSDSTGDRGMSAAKNNRARAAVGGFRTTFPQTPPIDEGGEVDGLNPPISATRIFGASLPQPLQHAPATRSTESLAYSSPHQLSPAHAAAHRRRWTCAMY